MLSVSAGALIMLLFVLVLGRPLVYTDTRSYLAVGAELSGQLLPHHGDADAKVLRGRNLAAKEEWRLRKLASTQAAARPPAYSLWLYLGSITHTFWSVVLLQAVFAAIVVTSMTAAAVGAEAALPMIVGLTLTSSLPIFVGFLMPDLFTSLAAILAAMLLAYGDRYSLAGRAGFALLLAFALAAHAGNVIIVGITGALCGALAWLWRRRAADCAFIKGGSWILAALGACLLSTQAYRAIAEHKLGLPILAPPFISARLLADGPAHIYLNHICHTDEESAFCPWKALPMASESHILWSRNPKLGVFEFADYNRRVRMIREEPRFALAAVLSDPASQAVISLRHFGRQLAFISPDEPLGSQTLILSNPDYRALRDLTPSAAACTARAAGCEPPVPLAALEVGQAAVVVLSLGLVAVLWQRLMRADPRLALAVAALLLAIAVNSLVCGVLSAPTSRYGARMAWLFPFAAALVALRLRRREASGD